MFHSKKKETNRRLRDNHSEPLVLTFNSSEIKTVKLIKGLKALKELK